MFRSIFHKFEFEFPFISPQCSLLTPQTIKDGDNIKTSSVVSVIDNSEILSKFTSRDFSVVALDSIGALGKLRSTYMSNLSDMNLADQFEIISVND